MNENKQESGFLSKCPLAFLIAVTAVVLTVMAVVGMIMGLYKPSWGWEHPALEVVLLNETAESTDSDDEQKESQAETTEAEAKSTDNSTENNLGVAESSGVQGTSESSATMPTTTPPTFNDRIARPMVYVDRAPIEVREPKYYDDPQKTPTNKVYDYVYGDNDYFADALFIGDSRIQGLYYYGGIDTATYAYLEGVSLFSVMRKELDLSTGGKGTIEQILENGDYKKVYLMFGLNELGDMQAHEFGQTYADIINRIKELEPQAVITIMGSMPISTDKSNNSSMSSYRNNDNINSRNYWSAFCCCDNTDVFYLDNNIPALLDEEGGLNTAYTNDGIHLSAQNYYILVDNIRNHCYAANMWN